MNSQEHMIYLISSNSTSFFTDLLKSLILSGHGVFSKIIFANEFVEPVDEQIKQSKLSG